MKRINFLFSFFLIFTLFAKSQQTSWQWVNPLPQGNILNYVWPISSDVIFAVGDYGTIIKTTNGGRTWQVKQNAAGITEPLFAVQFIDNFVGWAVGESGRVLKTTDQGNTWFIQNTPSQRDLFTVNFVSSSIGWVTGSLGTIMKTTDGGDSWSIQTTGTTSSFYGAHFLNSTTGYAIGTNGKIIATTNGGATWETRTSGTTQNLYGIQFVSSTVGYIVGSFGLTLKTIDGGNTWVPQVNATDFSLYSLHFTSALTGYATGSYGVIVKTTNGGFTWFEQPTGSYNDLFAIRFATSNIGWAVGDFGTIVVTTDGGATWVQQSSGVKNTLLAIHFPSGNVGVSVGEEGTIIRSTDGGSTWTQQTSGVMQTLYGVYMVNEQTGWAVGDSAVILKTTTGGYSWSEQNSHTDISLYSVFFINSTTGWTVGDFGTILKTTNAGLTWLPETTDITTPLMRVKFYNSNIGWVVGYGGEIIKTTDGGKTWTPQVSDTYQTLYSLEIIDANNVIAVGDFGTVVTTTDGGTTWTSQDTYTGSSFYGVAFSSGTTGWTVGDDGEIYKTTDGGFSWNLQRTPTYNTLWEIQLLRSGTSGGFLYATGIGGTILCSGVSPLPLRIWTGSYDSLWTSPINWSPVGTPQKGDSIFIPVTAHNPVYRSLYQQVNLAGMTIASGAKLTIGSGLAQLVVSGNIKIDGTLQLEENSNLEIICGGLLSFGLSGNLIPAKSTVALMGGGQIRGSFFNIFLAESTNVQSIGNIEIQNNITMLSDLSTRQIDTITILNPEPQGFQGLGVIKRGTIKRLIKQSATYDYRFESPVTYLKFYPTGTLPDTVTMTVYPNTLPPGLSDTAFARRYYIITPSGGSNYLSFLSLRYDTSETSIPVYDLGFFRDSGGIIYKMGITDYVDDDYIALNLDSVSKFSKWYIGKLDYEWKHPYDFTDTLIISDNGTGSDSLFFGTSPGATDGIDPAFGEVQLGPIPPSGTFDVRWQIPSTNGTRLDIRDILSYTHQQILYTGRLQAGAGGYPFTLQWNNQIFPVGTLTLRDAATHGTQFSIDMRNQNSFTITNPSISTFEILYVAPTYYQFKKGWNMVSIPIIPYGSNKKTSLFPTAISRAFAYNNFYYNADTLTHGQGYWLKFENDEKIGLDGIPITLDTIQTYNGWTMIGGIYKAVSVNNIIQIPSNIVTSNYFHYNIGYDIADSIRPAKGYWVKTKQAGKLVLTSTTGTNEYANLQKNINLDELNSITIIDGQGYKQTLYFSNDVSLNDNLEQFELPPSPPSDMFDVRYISNRFVEVLNAEEGTLKIKIQTTTYPLTIKWHSNEPAIQALRLLDSESKKQLSLISRDGTTQINNPNIKSINIKVESAAELPKKFSLEQNYPNPFNPSTKIEFALPTSANVTLKLYNVLGQEVTTLINNTEYSAGYHTIEINSNSSTLHNIIGSGVYFYKIWMKSEKQTFSAVRKMLLIK